MTEEATEAEEMAKATNPEVVVDPSMFLKANTPTEAEVETEATEAASRDPKVRLSATDKSEEAETEEIAVASETKTKTD